MIKKFVVGALSFFFLASPLFVSADAVTDLQVKLHELMGQLDQLKARQNGAVLGDSATCLIIFNSLSVDDIDAENNGEVTKLQQFLAQDRSIYPEGRITGYFGPATMRAVQRWQKAHGIVSSGDPDSTGYGFVGRKTRAAFAAGCSGGATTFTSPTNTNTPTYTYTTQSVTIDPSSLTATTGGKDAALVTITGSATNVNGVTVGMKGDKALSVAVSNGRWSATFTSVYPGVYEVQVTNTTTGVALAGGTLVVNTNSATNPTTVANPIIGVFYSSVNNIPSGSAATLSWSAYNTAQCGISVTGGNSAGLDLTKATSDASGITSVTTGPLKQTTTYELRCAPLTGATGGYVTKSVTVSVANPTATSAPTCTMSFTTSRGTETFTSSSQSGINARIMILSDDLLNITWASVGATQAFDYLNHSVSVSGSQKIELPQLNRTYQYQFNNAAGITTCTAIVYPVSASIDQNTLASNSANPTLTGSASGVQTVEVVVRKTVSDSVRIFDQTVPVINGRWSAAISSALTTGTYNVDIYGPSDEKLNYIVSGSLTVKIGSTSTTAPSCTVAASPYGVLVDQMFTLSWTSNGIAYVPPTNATGPSLYVGSHLGTLGIIGFGANGTQQYSDDVAENMSFQLGTGGIAGGPFVQLCSINVPVTSGSLVASNSGVRITSSLYPRTNLPFTVSGTGGPEKGTLYVVVVDGFYSGSRDWSVISGMVAAGNPTVVGSASSAVLNGTWSASFTKGYPENTHDTVLVYDPAQNNALVDTAMLYFTDKG